MKSKAGLLSGTVAFALALVFVVDGYTHKANTTTPMTNEPAGPITSLEDYSRMDKKRDRTAAFAKESPRSKSLLWRQHLAYQADKLKLNEQQRSFIKRVSEFLDEDFFVAPIRMSEAEYLKTSRGKPLRDVMQGASTLFTPEQSRQLFMTIGDIAAITDWSCGAPAKVQSNHANPKAATNSASMFGTCTCTASICGTGCTGNTTCMVFLPSPCENGGSCGCFGWFDCSGLCVPNYPD